MAGYSIADKDFKDNELRETYQNVKSRLNFTADDLDGIFEIVLAHRDRFPAINLKGDCTLYSYIERWVKSCKNAIKNIPSCRNAKPKSSCVDPSIGMIVKTICGLSDNDIEEGIKYHNLFMSAENIHGELLEEYIAFKIKPFGFIWCRGNAMAAIDFCNSNGTFSFQVKNRENTENSSSNKIRKESTIFIERWYRLGTKSEKNKKVAVYKWDTLNKLINDHKTIGYGMSPCHMTEADYQNFLHKTASENHLLITNQ